MDARLSGGASFTASPSSRSRTFAPNPAARNLAYIKDGCGEEDARDAGRETDDFHAVIPCFFAPSRLCAFASNLDDARSGRSYDRRARRERRHLPQFARIRPKCQNIRSKALDRIHMFVLLSERIAGVNSPGREGQVNFLSDTCTVRRSPTPGERRAVLFFYPIRARRTPILSKPRPRPLNM